jgi:hypothetical protein
LAVLAGLYIACKFPELRSRIVVVTFGAPQVGDGQFVRFFNEVVPTCVRVVNPVDIVPRLLDAQFVQVKGYYPVGAFAFSSLLNSHDLDTYSKALDLSPTLRTVAAFFPGVLAGLVVGGYIVYKMP